MTNLLIKIGLKIDIFEHDGFEAASCVVTKIIGDSIIAWSKETNTYYRFTERQIKNCNLAVTLKANSLDKYKV